MSHANGVGGGDTSIQRAAYSTFAHTMLQKHSELVDGVVDDSVGIVAALPPAACCRTIANEWTAIALVEHVRFTSILHAVAALFSMCLPMLRVPDSFDPNRNAKKNRYCSPYADNKSLSSAMYQVKNCLRVLPELHKYYLLCILCNGI